jgi:hypothetical protein
MSAAVKTFTEQDFAPGAAKVFDAVRQFGSAMIRTQKGDTFAITQTVPPPPTPEEMRAKFEAHWKRLRELGNVPPPPSEMERFNMIVAGEL